jgi:hypothetical protein
MTYAPDTIAVATEILRRAMLRFSAQAVLDGILRHDHDLIEVLSVARELLDAHIPATVRTIRRPSENGRRRDVAPDLEETAPRPPVASANLPASPRRAAGLCRRFAARLERRTPGLEHAGEEGSGR